MPSKRQLLLLGCVGWISILFFGKTTGTVYSKGTTLTCNHTVRIVFVSDNWTTRMIAGKQVRVSLQDHFLLVRLNMEKITKEKGLECAFDKRSVVLECCDMRKLAKLESAEGTELIELPDSTGEYEISTLNFVFCYFNMFLVLLVISLGLIITIRHSDTLLPLALRGRTIDQI